MKARASRSHANEGGTECGDHAMISALRRQRDPHTARAVETGGQRLCEEIVLIACENHASACPVWTMQWGGTRPRPEPCSGRPRMQRVSPAPEPHTPQCDGVSRSAGTDRAPCYTVSSFCAS